MSTIGKLIFKLFGWTGIFYLLSLLGVLFIVKDKDNPSSFDLKFDIIFTVATAISGTLCLIFRIKKKNAEKETIPEYHAPTRPAAPAPAPSSPLLNTSEIEKRIDAACPAMPAVRFQYSSEQTDIFDSKIGGIPYMPRDFEYPLEKSTGKPLRLLAQLNFSTIPHIDPFPEKGILQFFISADDDLYGCDLNDLTNNDKARVIYHENIITDRDMLLSAEQMPEIDMNGECPIISGCKLIPEAPSSCPVTSFDYRFTENLLRAYNDLTGESISSYWEINDDHFPPDAMEEFFDRRTSGGTYIGGYPFFTQDDPRSTEKYSDKTILLLEIDSADDIIMWGDSGTGTFHISPEDLKALRFDSVIYNYDCY